MKQISAIDAIMEFRKILKIVVDPVYDAISSLGNGIVSSYQSCEESYRKTFNLNTTKPSPEQQPQNNFDKDAQLHQTPLQIQFNLLISAGNSKN